MTTDLTRLWDELSAAWAQAASPAAPTSPVAWNRLADRIHALEEELLAANGGVAFVQQQLGDPALSEEQQAAVAGMFRLAAGLLLEDRQQFRNHPRVDLGKQQLPVAPSLLLVETDIEERHQEGTPLEEGRVLSRTGGHPTASPWDWPVTSEEVPLEFLARVDLAGEAQMLGHPPTVLQELGLPTTGVLQVFYDMLTDHRDAGADPRGVCVRHLGEDILETAVRNGRHPAAFAERALAAVPAPSVGCPPSGLTEEALARFEHVASSIEAQCREIYDETVGPTAAVPEAPPMPPSSRLRGLGHHEHTEEITAALHRVLPLHDPADEHLLLVDLAGNRNREGAFGEMGHLQIWIRRSDLIEAAFTDMAVFQRTD